MHRSRLGLLILATLLAAPSLFASPRISYSDLTARSVINAVKTRHPTAEALVRDILPTEFTERNILMPYSRSSQAASPDAPRAIFFNEDASLRIALSKDGTLEVSDFDFSSGRFRYYPQLALQGSQKKNLLSSKDCLRCHAVPGSNSPHPIWDDEQWPEAWGDVVGMELEPFNIDHYFAQRTGFHQHLYKTASPLVYTFLLQNLNGHRAVREIAGIANHESFKTPLLHALVDSPFPDILATLPANLLADPAQLPSRYAELRDDTLTEFERNRQHVFHRWMRGRHRDTADKQWSFRVYDLDSFGGLASIERAAKLRLVLEVMGKPELADGWTLGHHDPEEYSQFIDAPLRDFLEREWPTRILDTLTQHTRPGPDQFFAEGDWWRKDLSRFNFSARTSRRNYDFGFSRGLDQIAIEFVQLHASAPEDLIGYALESLGKGHRPSNLDPQRFWSILHNIFSPTCSHAMLSMTEPELAWTENTLQGYRRNLEREAKF